MNSHFHGRTFAISVARMTMKKIQVAWPGVRSASSETLTTKAPMMTPPRLPAPPRISIA